MKKKKIAFITSIPSEENFLPFHYKIKNIAKEKYNIDIDLLKNGEFIYSIKDGVSYIYYRDKKFFIDDYSLVLIRFAIKYPHGGDNYIIREFEKRGILTINSSDSTVKSRDKLYTLQLLNYNNIPITPTFIIRTRDNIKEALKLIGNPPYIIKNCFGSGGDFVLQALNLSQVYSIFDYIWKIDRNEILLIQPYLGTKPASDIRVICLNYKVWKSIKREVKDDEFRANIKKGAQAYPVELSREEKILCEKVSKLMNLKLAGIDFLRTKEGPKILEVNSCPGFKGIIKVYGEKILEELVENLILLNIENNFEK